MLEENTVLIILNYKNYTLTNRIIQNLNRLKFLGEIIVVDNNSPNESFEVLSKEYDEYEKIHVIKNIKNSGYAQGNNFGIQYALTNIQNVKYIGIVNPDVVLDEKFSFERLITKIENDEEIVGITPFQLLNGEFSFKNVGWKLPNFWLLLITNLTFLRFLLKYNLYDNLETLPKNLSTAYIDVMPGSFFIIKRDWFEKIGFFDEETFMYSEEIILSAKMKKENKRFAVSIDQYYLHDHQKKDSDLESYQYYLRDYKWKIQSQEHYLKTYLGDNVFYNIIFFLGTRFHLYFEIPVVLKMKKILKKVS